MFNAILLKQKAEIIAMNIMETEQQLKTVTKQKIKVPTIYETDSMINKKAMN